MITDELRKWKSNIQTYLSPEAVLQLRCELNAIADRIDEKHKRECNEQYAAGAEHGIGASIEASMIQDHGYVELPKDIDGEYICIGDVIDCGESTFKVNELRLTKAGWNVGDCRHHKPTVEDVLREFVSEFNRDDTELCDEEIIERFAAKLRLADRKEQ